MRRRFHPGRAAVACTLALLGHALIAATAAGPLRTHPVNPRYFTDGTTNAQGAFKIVYLTGSHTWNSLVDMSPPGESATFDFAAYLDFLERHGHNFIRLWAWDSTTWDTRANGVHGKTFVHTVEPLPWQRIGPGIARDGRPKFDLTKFDPAYFDRLRRRVESAGQRGIYVSVMLFEGWGLFIAGRNPRGSTAGWSWITHPFHPDNNVNGVPVEVNERGIGQVHALGGPELQRLQQAYIHQVVDTVNAFDHVLYEVINEGGQEEWTWWVANTLRAYQAEKPRQHPVGITGHGPAKLAGMLASPADWISPGRNDGYGDDPPVWEGKKISLLDTDHVWGLGGSAAWVWKSFLGGHNPIFMDPWDESVLESPAPRRWESVRRAMGDTRRFAERLDLARMTPQPQLASTGHCLALPGREYLVFQQKAGDRFRVTLAPGTYTVSWFDPQRSEAEPPAELIVTQNRPREFEPPFDGIAVLHLVRRDASTTGSPHNRVSPAEATAGWQLLFDGETFNGWRGYRQSGLPDAGWVISDGALRAIPIPRGGELITREKFSDFEFSWEWRIDAGGNSGVKYFVTEERPRAPGHEYQLIDDARHPDGQAGPKSATGAFYDVLASAPDKPLRPAGEWNQSRLLVQGNRVEHWLNDRIVLSYDLGSPALRAALAASKFRHFADFGTKQNGHIMLTHHQDGCWFRNLKIRRLD